ncbi:hydroxymethylpyrimidine/phosphomethylpyrimidine kinase [Duganella sp. BJB488]|uniref:bifunctional hydroxymethylpyrimidine kinase/phosphomethylpyrimidine kinase n=1 Tax=unclassified Duganella TaxID=2636909 RepID=UPI000E35134D|nr:MULTISPECIES: bifunctional hydroxymethylpyrimidine kinase/phosphomethylpyrimidine kinase [unclassified Duganella]RFP26315.1 hydroxymethylpyrimidine/phosphomethylpyrimidine kinase [Duganella sp. BJB489]RFP27944.1 hydroxymethylpyrimidine/phosphomethylpyrimidine kinase [Duganella sp. BJB488]RFP37247.1 hydroxymethylpyrimidine/phosphomethylpyrimidine kinase [Duganella sp. BJB480]
MQNQTSPLILSFGAADPAGAIGVQADLAVFSALSCNGLAVTTALLIGDSARVEDAQDIDPDWVSDQARVILEDMSMAAFKVGALTNIEQVAAIAEILSDYPDAPLILDPFSSRLPDPADADEAEELLTALRQLLVPQATLLMLSQVELGRLAETWREGAEDTMESDVEHLLALGCEFVLVTGTQAGTPQGETAAPNTLANTLFGADGMISHDAWQHMPGPFLGAGGTLSAAITAFMARGADVPEAVTAAQEYTVGALAHAQRYGMGKFIPNRFFHLHQALPT